MLICQSAHGLAFEADLGGCADRSDGAQFLSKNTPLRFKSTLYSGLQTVENYELSSKTLATSRSACESS